MSMIKLFYSAGACSTSCHIAVEEAGLDYQGILIDFDQADANLAELERLNPLKAAPVMVNEQGKTLTQNIAILQFIADSKPESRLLPPAGTWERLETMSWLSFVASDFHKSFVPLFAGKNLSANETTQKEIRTWAEKSVHENLLHIDRSLAGKDFITGDTFTIADAYLFVAAGWCKYVGVYTDQYKNLNAFLARVYQRPAVQRVLAAEGLLE